MPPPSNLNQVFALQEGKKKVRAYTTSMYYTHNLKSKIRYWLTASKLFEKEIEAVFGKTKLILTCVGCFNRMMGS